MARWPTGVSVVTATDGKMDAGLTANAVLSVSLAPPTLLVSIAREADTGPLLARSGRFGVSLLAYDQRAISELFARPVPSAEKFAGLTVRRGLGGVPLIPNGLAYFVCRLSQTWEADDHQLFLGTVEVSEAGRDVAPLVFFRSSYAAWEPPDALRLPPPKGST